MKGNERKIWKWMGIGGEDGNCFLILTKQLIIIKDIIIIKVKY